MTRASQGAGHEVSPLRIRFPKRSEIPGLGRLGFRFTLAGHHTVPPPWQHEIDFRLLLIPPEERLGHAGRHQRVLAFYIRLNRQRFLLVL